MGAYIGVARWCVMHVRRVEGARRCAMHMHMHMQCTCTMRVQCMCSVWKGSPLHKRREQLEEMLVLAEQRERNSSQWGDTGDDTGGDFGGVGSDPADVDQARPLRMHCTRTVCIPYAYARTACTAHCTCTCTCTCTCHMPCVGVEHVRHAVRGRGARATCRAWAWSRRSDAGSTSSKSIPSRPPSTHSRSSSTTALLARRKRRPGVATARRPGLLGPPLLSLS
jgi:hypothetical protein